MSTIQMISKVSGIYYLEFKSERHLRAILTGVKTAI